MEIVRPSEIGKFFLFMTLSTIRVTWSLKLGFGQSFAGHLIALHALFCFLSELFQELFWTFSDSLLFPYWTVAPQLSSACGGMKGVTPILPPHSSTQAAASQV